MLIKDLFELPIARDINPAVTVGAIDARTIDTEISEYVVTDDILERAFKFLTAIANYRQQKAGIWVNGYYGSGKSHFIKFMHYCLGKDSGTQSFEKLLNAAEKYDAYAVGHNEEITEARMQALRKKLVELTCKTILFNVEAVTDSLSGERLTRILLNMFNKFRSYNESNIPLAILLEKPLDKAGKFLEFKKRVSSRMQHNWDMEAADLAAFKLESVLEIAKELLPDLDTKSLHNTLTNSQTYHIGISSKLIPELKEYVQEQGDSFRLVFLVDEISQYIGQNKEILLNLQTIVEEVSSNLNGKVWIALTAQQTLEEVVDRFDTSSYSDEFGKILGRFDTRISLESNDASIITRRRVLGKNAAGIKELTQLYQQKKDFIEHQFKLPHDLYKGYTDGDDFILSYPFVPYQFRLIADVFSAFQRMNFVITEVKNNERSIIAVTHFTAKEHAGNTVGSFIPFDKFFNELFKNNLTHFGGRIIERALGLSYVRKNDFAIRVVKILFMVSNLEDSVLRTFPPTTDNLTILLMTELDQNRSELQKLVKEVLERLKEENIIREENGKFFFYSEDEIQVANQIRNTTPTLDDKITLLDELLRPVLKVDGKVSLEQNDVRISYSIDDKDFLRNGDIKVGILLWDNQRVEDKAVNVPANDLYICMNEWFLNDQAFRKELDGYIKTITYFTINSSSATGEREKTINIIKSRNDSVKTKLLAKLIEKFAEARFISLQQIFDSSAVNGNTPRDRYNNLLNFHLQRVFKFMKLATGFVRTKAELEGRLNQPIQADIGELSLAEAKVEEMIVASGNEISIEDLVKKFSKIPFGWKDVAVIEMVLRLNARQLRDLEYKGTPRFAPKSFLEKAITTSERSSCWVKPVSSFDAGLVTGATKSFGDIFKKPIASLSTDGYKLTQQLHEQLGPIASEYKDLRDKFYKDYPFGEVFNQLYEQIIGWINIQDAKRFLRELIEAEPVAKELRDKAEKSRQFITLSLAKYNEIRHFITGNKQNLDYLDAVDRGKASEVHQFFMNPEPASTFRVVVKQYEELKKALDINLTNLRQQVVERYQQVFAELAEVTQAENLDANNYGQETKMQQLQVADSITQLQLELSKADAYKAEKLEQLFLGKPKPMNESGSDGPADKPKTRRYKVSRLRSTISNTEELNEFITRLTSEMSRILSENQTIIIE